MTTVLEQDWPRDIEAIRRGIVGVSVSRSNPLYDLHPSSFASGPQDEWDRNMKENYEEGGALRELVERGREDYRTGNVSPLP